MSESDTLGLRSLVGRVYDCDQVAFKQFKAPVGKDPFPSFCSGFAVIAPCPSMLDWPASMNT